MRSTVKPPKVREAPVEVPVSGSAYGWSARSAVVAERTGTRSLATLWATNVLAEGAGVLEFAKPAKSCGSSSCVYCGLAVNESVNEFPLRPAFGTQMPRAG